MRMKRILSTITVAVLSAAMCVSTASASPIRPQKVTDRLTLVTAQGEDNHFHAYAGGTKKSKSIIYSNPEGFRLLYVDLAGDDLSKVTYKWQTYASLDDLNRGNVSICYSDYERTIILLGDHFDPYLTCTVSDGYGNSETVTFEIREYDEREFAGVNNANLTLKTGNSMNILNILNDFKEGGKPDWTITSVTPSVLSFSNSSTIKGIKPGLAVLEGIPYEGYQPAVFTVQVQYKDVTNKSDYWYAPVYWGTNNGIIGGYDDGTFRADNKCTRAQMVTFLWRMAGCPEPKTTKNPFRDVTNTKAYYYKAMLWGAETGIVGGYQVDGGKQEFRPDTVCSRQQAVTFLWRLAGSPEPKSLKSSFRDVQNRSSYSYRAILWADEVGITSGYSDGTFRPQDDCVRRQMASFLYRYDLKTQKE